LDSITLIYFEVTRNTSHTHSTKILLTNPQASMNRSVSILAS